MSRPSRFKRRRISRPAYLLIKAGLIFSAVLLAADLLLAVYTGPLTAHNVHTHRFLADLYRTPQAVLLITHLGALILEDRLA